MKKIQNIIKLLSILFKIRQLWRRPLLKILKKWLNGQADQILQDAQLQARKHTEDLSRQEFELRVKIEETKKKFDMYKAKMEALLISQLELLKDDGNDNN